MNYLKYIAKTNRANQHPYGEKGTNILLSFIPKSSKNILEIGCGTGHTAAIISQSNYIKYTGIDNSIDMINACNKRKKALKLKNCNFYHVLNNSFSYNDNSFDVVFCESILGIQTIDNLNVLLKEIKRVLKNGGILIANESLWKQDVTLELKKSINNIVYPKYGLVQAGEKNTKKTWMSILLNQGFNVLRFDNLLDVKITEKGLINHINNRYTSKQKSKSILNPKYLFQYLYFKFWELKLKDQSKYINPYLIICEN